MGTQVNIIWDKKNEREINFLRRARESWVLYMEWEYIEYVTELSPCRGRKGEREREEERK